MATNNAVSFNQLKKSVFNMKNYINDNMNSDNVYKGYKELMDFSFDIDENCMPKEGFFDFSVISNNYNAYYKVIELDKEYDFTDKRNFVKREIISKNYDLTNGKGSNIKETNCPYSLLYFLSGYNGEDNINILSSVYYGKKYYLDESTGKSAFENNNKYISLLYQVNLSKYDTTKDHDFSDTIRYIFSLNEFNTNSLLQFPLFKAYNRSIIPSRMNETEHTIGDYSISMDENSDITSHSIIMGQNTFPSSYASSYLAMFGYDNKVNMSYSVIIGGISNEVTPYYSGSGLTGVTIIGNSNKINEVKKNNYSGVGIIGENLKVEGNGLYVGAYGTVPYSEVFAVCQGTSSQDKTLFSINRDTGAVTSESTPTEDNHLTTKKYVDDINIEATDEEIDAMLLEVLGGDYSVQS